MNKTIIVSNRLPFEVKIANDQLRVSPSAGGLATGLKSVHETANSVWVGWSGVQQEDLDENLSRQIESAAKAMRCQNVPLSKQELQDYYYGFSNKALWPMFHYFLEYAEFELFQWEAYQRVNRKFADAILSTYTPGDNIWIHDYQLLLVPMMVREKCPDAAIGFFLHIPFPSFEILRTCPWREELLKGMLGASVIGFHTYDYERHFISSVKRILDMEVRFNEIVIDQRMVKVDSFPMGIDYEKFHSAAIAHDLQTAEEKSELQRKLDEHGSFAEDQLILSIDRLDYTKGIPSRILAFEYFLEKFPQFRERVHLIMLAVPSRSNVKQYQRLKRETDELVGRVNGRFGTVNWTPIWYFYRSMPFENLIDLYSSCHVAMITPIRDGMNLVAKEYVATRTRQDGVLILSEMAGAAKELTEALLINPNNYEQIAQMLKYALEMPAEEQRFRMQFLQKRLRPYTVTKWAQEFLNALEVSKHAQPMETATKINDEIITEISDHYKAADKKLVLLDYDGTLVGFKNDPKDAYPDSELLDLLENINRDRSTDLTLISGRDKDTMEQWFGGRGFNLITDHGVWLQKSQSEWEALERLKSGWKQNIRPILENYASRTPGTFIEEKEFSIAWHYRKADLDLAQMRVMELKNVLTGLIENDGLALLEGNKVLEIKSSSINKGKAASRMIARESYDFIMAIGDDYTDEFMFEELPETAYTIRVGLKKTVARHSIDFQNVRPFLKKLVEQ